MALCKAVIPVGGLGTRMLPVTKSIPKEMLNVVDRPLIQLIIDEARQAGIDQFILVTGRNKHAIEDYFDVSAEIEWYCSKQRKSKHEMCLGGGNPGPGKIMFTRQQEPLGLAHAVWCARHMVGNEPFILMLPDMIFEPQSTCLKDMVALHREFPDSNIIATHQVPVDEITEYGMVVPKSWSEGHYTIEELVEKPHQSQVISNQVISGRYIIQPKIFEAIESIQAGDGEIQLTDAIRLLKHECPLIGHTVHEKIFDCGSKLGLLLANITFALSDAKFRAKLTTALMSQMESTTFLTAPATSHLAVAKQ
jgi:UTP--glucose-1-phosphate uridylyltransferase